MTWCGARLVCTQVCVCVHKGVHAQEVNSKTQLVMLEVPG